MLRVRALTTVRRRVSSLPQDGLTLADFMPSGWAEITSYELISYANMAFGISYERLLSYVIAYHI